MNPNWNTDGWGLLRRLIWIGVAIACCIGALRLMAWADTGSRGECPVEKSILPK